MTSKKCCAHCQSYLIKLQQCQCPGETFDALENFTSVTSGEAPKFACFRSHHCCHLVKWICPDCCQNKIPLHCCIYWHAVNGKVFGEIFFQEKSQLNINGKAKHSITQPRFDW